MRWLPFLLFILTARLGAQWIPLAIPSEILQSVADFEADDYGNVYLYRSGNFSATKLDSLGRMQGRLLQAVPFRLQSIQNPLQITMFSEALQEVRLYDGNLAEIQRIPLREFGYIRSAYLQDQQMLWLADVAGRRIIQYDYRQNQLISSIYFPEDLSSLQDFLFFEGKFYLLRAGKFEVYDKNLTLLLALEAKDAIQLRRDNATIFVTFPTSLSRFDGAALIPLLPEIPGGIIDKTASRIYLLKDGKLSYKNL